MKRKTMIATQVYEGPGGKVSYGQPMEVTPERDRDAEPLVLSHKEYFPRVKGAIEFALPSGAADRVNCGDLIMIDEERDAKLVLKGKLYKIIMIATDKRGERFVQCAEVTP